MNMKNLLLIAVLSIMFVSCNSNKNKITKIAKSDYENYMFEDNNQLKILEFKWIKCEDYNRDLLDKFVLKNFDDEIDYIKNVKLKTNKENYYYEQLSIGNFIDTIKIDGEKSTFELYIDSNKNYLSKLISERKKTENIIIRDKNKKLIRCLFFVKAVSTDNDIGKIKNISDTIPYIFTDDYKLFNPDFYGKFYSDGLYMR